MHTLAILCKKMGLRIRSYTSPIENLVETKKNELNTWQTKKKPLPLQRLLWERNPKPQMHQLLSSHLAEGRRKSETRNSSNDEV